MRRPLAIVTVVACIAWVGANLIPVAHAGNTIRVNTTRDELNNDGDCSLREAIVAANNNAPEDGCRRGDGADRILIPAGTYDLRRPGANEQDAEKGDLDTQGNLTIIGDGPSRTHILGSAAFGDRIFDVTGGKLVLRKLRIARGRAPDDTGGDPTRGGGIVKRFGADLVLGNVTVSTNKAAGAGGGLSSEPSPIMPPPPPEGTTTIRNSTVVNNKDLGVVSQMEERILIVGSTISSNKDGGMVAVNTLRVALVRSATSNNRENGLTIVNADNVRLVRSRASGNGTNNAGGAGVIIQDGSPPSHVTVNNFKAHDNEGFGMALVNTSEIDVQNSSFVRNLQGLAIISGTDVDLERVRVARSESAGAQMVDVSNVQMSRMTFSRNGDDGLQLVTGTDVELGRATANGNDGTGLLFVNVTQQTLRNSSTRNNEDIGILAVTVPQLRMNHVRTVGNEAITSPGAGLLLVNAADAQLSDVVAANNRSTQSGGGIDMVAAPGLEAQKLIVRNNFARTGGGGIELIGSPDQTVAGMKLVGNATRSHAGGGLLAGNTDLLLKNATVAGNEARGTIDTTLPFPRGSGGGLMVVSSDGTQISGSTISGNDARGHGGGLLLQNNGLGPADTELVNSTVSGNSSGGGDAKRGGGLYVENSFVSLLNSTVTRNDSPSGGGAFARLIPEDPPDADPNNDPESIVEAENTILAGQRGGGDCRGNGTFDSDGHNLTTSGACYTLASDREGDPKLGPLADNGGRTKTHLLLAGSPARDHGGNTDCPARDQRGRNRPATPANRCDIGSVEMASGGGGAASAGYAAGVLASEDGGESCSDSALVEDRLDATETMMDEVLEDMREQLGDLQTDPVPPGVSSPADLGAVGGSLAEAEDATSSKSLAAAC